jgi:nucleotide-binding universal stress UspA family protein
MAWKTIVAATDGSERSIAAAQFAANLARESGAKLHIVTVVRPPEGWWGIEGAPPPPRAMSEAVVDARQSILDGTMSKLDQTDLDVTTALEIGEPSGTIVKYCEDVEADLLVLGRRGAGIIERFVMGSVADRLAHYSPCPILIIP